MVNRFYSPFDDRTIRMLRTIERKMKNGASEDETNDSTHFS